MSRARSTRFGRTSTVAGFCIFTLLGLQPAPGATAAEVGRAIDAGKNFLFHEMKNGNNWEKEDQRDARGSKTSLDAGQWGARTALAVYALLASGVDSQDPRLVPAIKWLKSADMVGTYALAMRCQVWLMLPRTDEIRQLARADRDRAQHAFNNSGKAKFLYSYVNTRHDLDSIDHHISQYGVLSMWACAQLGIEMEQSYWSQVEKRWMFDQQPDGSWLFSDKASSKDHPGEDAAMTAAGVSTLFVTQDYYHQNDGIKCTGNIENPKIESGLKWLGDHVSDWTPSTKANETQVPAYPLFAIERIAAASGYKFLGKVDWYQYGADWCLKNQSGKTGSFYGDHSPVNTAQCLLFLASGRAPVVVNKVQYDGPWNQRPRDVANFARWMAAQTERDINWQITNLDLPERDLHDAPFLYISGNKPLAFKPEYAEKLKQFVLHGGMILFNSDCGQASGPNAFVTSVIELGRQLFPDYEFRDLPETHPVFTSEQYPPARWKQKVVLRSLGNGARELMVILPNDPAKSWQLHQSSGAGHEEAFQATDDVILYGTDKTNLPLKGQSFLVNADPAIKATDSIKIARLKYNRNWNPEPGGWDRLSAIMHNQARVDLTVDTVELSDKPITGYKIAHLTGTTILSFSTPQLQQLKNFVQEGGTLIVDCAGGSSDFAQSIEPMLSKIFPSGLTSPLPSDDAIYSLGFPNVAIHYRSFAKSILGSVKGPAVKTIQISGRNAVYYSRYDLSTGLVGQPVDGIVGYDPESSTEIMSGIILKTMGRQ